MSIIRILESSSAVCSSLSLNVNKIVKHMHNLKYIPLYSAGMLTC